MGMFYCQQLLAGAVTYISVYPVKLGIDCAGHRVIWKIGIYNFLLVYHITLSTSLPLYLPVDCRIKALPEDLCENKFLNAYIYWTFFSPVPPAAYLSVPNMKVVSIFKTLLCMAVYTVFIYYELWYAVKINNPKYNLKVSIYMCLIEGIMKERPQLCLANSKNYFQFI